MSHFNNLLRTAYLGLGSNLGSPAEEVTNCIRELANTAGITLSKCSSLYRTAPQGFTGQPDFVNAAVEIRTRIAPVRLLKMMRLIERKHRRERTFPNGPRTLDVDVILYEQLQLSTPDLTLPHPRAHERAFVLMPLIEIAPNIVLPGFGRADECLQRCIDQPMRLLIDSRNLAQAVGMVNSMAPQKKSHLSSLYTAVTARTTSLSATAVKSKNKMTDNNTAAIEHVGGSQTARLTPGRRQTTSRV